jgi:predicted Ser/Thr protein kinase
MERRFSVEAKSFSFSVVSGKPVLRLEERRKGFKGFILLGIKASVWLADMVEEACETQKREDFARSLCDEVRVLKVRMGRNRFGSFLEARYLLRVVGKG